MSLYQGRLRRMRLVAIRDIERYAGRRVKVCGWFVTTRRVTTERGRQMRFLSVEDMTGVLETVLFPAAYARYGHLLTTSGPYLLTGTVQNDHTHCTLTVDGVEVVDRVEVVDGVEVVEKVEVLDRLASDAPRETALTPARSRAT